MKYKNRNAVAGQMKSSVSDHIYDGITDYADKDMNKNGGGIPMGTGISQDPNATNSVDKMSKERLKTVMTQYLQSKQDDEINLTGQAGQLLDRKASDNFQG